MCPDPESVCVVRSIVRDTGLPHAEARKRIWLVDTKCDPLPAQFATVVNCVCYDH